MNATIEPKVTLCQELIVTSRSATIEPMVTKTTQTGFADRLNRALDDHGVPPKGSGRQVIVARMFGVPQKGARKWLEAEATPKTTRIEEMAERLNVSGEWLLTGRGDMRVRNGHEAAPVLEAPAQHKSPAMFDVSLLTAVFDAIDSRWPNWPFSNEELASIVADCYARAITGMIDKDRAAISAILSQSTAATTSVQQRGKRAGSEEDGGGRHG